MTNVYSRDDIGVLYLSPRSYPCAYGISNTSSRRQILVKTTTLIHARHNPDLQRRCHSSTLSYSTNIRTRILIAFLRHIYVHCYSETHIHPLPHPQILSRFHCHHHGHNTLRWHLLPYMGISPISFPSSVPQPPDSCSGSYYWCPLGSYITNSVLSI